MRAGGFFIYFLFIFYFSYIKSLSPKAHVEDTLTHGGPQEEPIVSKTRVNNIIKSYFHTMT